MADITQKRLRELTKAVLVKSATGKNYMRVKVPLLKEILLELRRRRKERVDANAEIVEFWGTRNKN